MLQREHMPAAVPAYGSAIVLTLRLDETGTAFFNRQRARYFPAYCNRLPAHLTLFHRLPCDIPGFGGMLTTCCQRLPFQLQVTGLLHWENGVAYSCAASGLEVLHADLQRQLAPWLVARDKELFLPHITIQNKVTAFKAQQLYRQLDLDFIPFEVSAEGIDVWYYSKGSWIYYKSQLFDAAPGKETGNH